MGVILVLGLHGKVLVAGDILSAEINLFLVVGIELCFG